MRVNVLSNGRLVLPVDMRRRLGVERGGQIVVELDGDVIRLTTPDQALDEARALFLSYVPDASSVADEVVADRRAEAARDAGDAAPA